MKHPIRALVAVALIAGTVPAFTQQFPTVPDHSVIGRIGSGSSAGPSQAIPFSNLAVQLGVAPDPAVYATSFGVKCDGATDDSAAAQLAITAAAGKPVVFPAGTCVISSGLTYNTSSSSFFAQGPQIYGQGREKTIFDNRVANGYLFSGDTQADSKFQSGAIFKDFKITTTTSPGTSGGIKLHRTAYAKFENLQITGLTGNGIYVPASVGDADAAFEVVVDRVRMDNISGWCGDFSAPSGGYFGSNLRISNSTFQSCGTASASVPPTSGSIRLKGLIAQIVNSGFTLNNNVDLYIQGADTSLNVSIEGVDFENNISTVLPHVYIDSGLRGFHMVNSECLNNDSFVGQGCVWFNSTSPIGNITIDKTEVRATTLNNTYTAFKNTSTNALTDTIRVGNIYWQTFDLSGQTRFSGFGFTGITGQAKFQISALNTALLSGIGYGFSMPLHLAANGEWVEYQIPNTGITKTGIGGLSPSTAYYFYLYNSASANAPYAGTIEVSATSPISDTVSGYFVKNGDTTRTFIGSATTDGAGNFPTSVGQSSQYPAGTLGTSVLAVANGGSGRATLTTGGILIGEGTAAVNITAAMTNGQILVGQTGADPLPKTITADGSISPAGGLTVSNVSGTATNDNAASGKVGEYISSAIASGSAVSLTTATPANMTSVSLTAGDWDVSCNVYFNIAATTNITNVIGSISTTSATLDGTTMGAENIQRYAAFVPGGGTQNLIIGPQRFSLAGTTTVYCVAQSAFTVSTNAAFGLLRARRVR